MFEFIYAQMLVLHIISVMIAVGTVTVTDYLHVLGLRDRKVETKSLFVFPYLSRLIIISLVVIYITGSILVFTKPEVLANDLFWIKLALVIIVTVNGFILHHHVFPRIEKATRKNIFPDKLLNAAAFGGSLSIVSWYSIVVLSITKDLGYTAAQFVIGYIIFFIIAYVASLNLEKFMRKS